MNLESKIGLITGGTGGIGAATALEFARHGAQVALVARKMDGRAEKVRDAVRSAGGRCELIRGDMAKPKEATGCVEETIRRFGGVDILVHAAGEGARGGLLDTSIDAWYYSFETHVHALFHLCRACVPAMRTKRQGAIIAISSTAGLRGCVGAFAYGIAKGALPNFVRALARELADDNVRVNCVSPGIIRTHFQDYLTPEQVRHNVEQRIPLHREGKPEDVAEIITLLAVNDYVTGENFVIDGGQTMRIA
jgi:NAD(P)-dependent dehydrogenase (short-subunit alcohol dehydrogenase family)